MAWAVGSSSRRDVQRVLGPAGRRVHAVERGWLSRLGDTRLYAYRLPAGSFRPIGSPRPHAFVSTGAVRPLAPAEPVGDLLELHHAAGSELRVLDSVWPFWDAVVGSSLAFSGIRLRNAVPRSA